jgi:ribosomal-protein-alanine N-acetyltransferase
MRAMAFMERPAPLEVTLRPAAPRDADLLRQWRAEASVRRFQPLNELPTAQLRADVASQRIADLYRGRGEKFQWIVQVDNQPGGWITLVVSNWEHGLAEVGYALSTIYQGRGVMGESLQILLDDLFHNTLLERIEARCAVENYGSQRVLEKNGFSQEGRLRGYFKLRGRRVDNFLYGLLREDYLARRRGVSSFIPAR